MTSRSRYKFTALITFAALLTPASAFATVGQPTEIINRPRTLPGGELELNGGIDLDHTSSTTQGMTTSSSSFGAPLGIAYGVTDDFELRLFYSLALHPTFTGKTAIEVRPAYTFFRGDRLTAAAQVRTGIELAGNTVTPLRLGVNAQYRVTDRFAIFTPGEQLSVALSGPNKPIWLDLPVGAAVQFTSRVFGSLTTNLAHIAIANGNGAFILADMLPVDLAAFYSFSNRADIGAHFDIDVEHSDHFQFGVLARLFM